MNVTDAIAQRRSIRKFEPRTLSREELDLPLHAATLAPNHRMTQPWRFYVLGPQARAAYGLALGNRKAKKAADEAAADAIRRKTSDEHRDLPCMIAVAMVVQENPEIREEDYAATMMAVENFMLAAVAQGLGTHIKSGAIMEDPAARAAVGVSADQKIVAVLNVGVPAEVPPGRERLPVASVTTWVD